MSYPNNSDKFESGTRKSTRPNLTITESSKVLNNWIDLVNDYEILHEHYDTADPEIYKAFILAKLPSEEEIQKHFAHIKTLHATIKAGTTAQRDQYQLHVELERSGRLITLIGGPIDRLRLRLRALGLREPGDDDETSSQNLTISSNVAEPPTPLQTHGPNFTPSGPSAISPQAPISSLRQRLQPGYREQPVSPPPIPSLQQRLQPRYREQSVSPPPPPPVPSLRQRLQPRYREHSVSPPPSEPPVQFPSQPRQQACQPGVGNDVGPQNEEILLDVHGIARLYNIQVGQLKAKDAEIARLKAELERERNKKK